MRAWIGKYGVMTKPWTDPSFVCAAPATWPTSSMAVKSTICAPNDPS